MNELINIFVTCGENIGSLINQYPYIIDFSSILYGIYDIIKDCLFNFSDFLIKNPGAAILFCYVDYVLAHSFIARKVNKELKRAIGKLLESTKTIIKSSKKIGSKCHTKLNNFLKDFFESILNKKMVSK